MLTLTEDLHLVRRAANAATTLEYDAGNDTGADDQGGGCSVVASNPSVSHK